MSEPTPVFDPPVLENGTSAVEGEGSASTTDNGAPKENNGQDVTMAGLEEPGVKVAKTGADPAVSDAICYIYHHRPIHFTWIAFTTTSTIHIHRKSQHDLLDPTCMVWSFACT